MTLASTSRNQNVGQTEKQWKEMVGSQKLFFAKIEEVGALLGRMVRRRGNGLYWE